MQQNRLDTGDGEGQSMILDEEIDENYEPTQEGIKHLMAVSKLYEF